MPRRSRLATGLVVAASLVALVAAPAGAKTDKVQTTKFHVSLTSQATTLQQVGAGGEITYGWNHLTGTAPSDSGNIGVDLLGNVQYTNRVGTFFGFVTLHFASLSDVAFRMQGKTTKTSDGASHFTSKLKVIGGSAALIGVKGGGSWTGSRTGQLGSPVEADFTIKLGGITIG